AFAGSGTTYTATWTPPASDSGSATIGVAANRFTDAANNQNTAAVNLSLTYDTRPPASTTTTLASSGSGSNPTATTTVGQSTGTAVTTPVTPVGPSTATQLTTTTSTTSSTISARPGSLDPDEIDAIADKNAAAPPKRAPRIGAEGITVLVDDQEVEASIERTSTEYVVRAVDSTVRLGVRTADGQPTDIDSSGRLRASRDGRVGMGVEGFAPESPVAVWMFSDPVDVGTAQTGSGGAVVSQFMLRDDTPAGDHTVVLVGTDTSGKKVTVAVGLILEDESSAGSARQAPKDVDYGDGGGSLNVWLIGLPIALAIFGALFLPARIRRREEEPVSGQ
ncbi:MAG: hypothetical protein ACKORY_08635, partial [Actinomycetota bacterium]